MPRSGSDTAALRLDSLPTWLLSRSSGRAHRLLADAFAAAGARGYHYRVLAALEDLGPASQATVGRRAEVGRPARVRGRGRAWLPLPRAGGAGGPRPGQSGDRRTTGGDGPLGRRRDAERAR